MNKLKFLLIFVFILLITLSGCQKYDYGPAISFRSKKNRVVGKWITEKWLINKYTDTSVTDTNRRAEFTDDGTYYYHDNNAVTNIKTDLKGTWAFRQDKEQLLLGLPTGNNGDMIYQLWDIIKLKNKELWLEMVNYGYPNSLIYEWRLKPE